MYFQASAHRWSVIWGCEEMLQGISKYISFSSFTLHKCLLNWESTWVKASDIIRSYINRWSCLILCPWLHRFIVKSVAASFRPQLCLTIIHDARLWLNITKPLSLWGAKRNVSLLFIRWRSVEKFPEICLGVSVAYNIKKSISLVSCCFQRSFLKLYSQFNQVRGVSRLVMVRRADAKANERLSGSVFFFTDRQQIQLTVPQALLGRPEGGDPHER